VTTAAVFFEGAGGSTCGLRDAGYDTIGYEIWQPAIDTSRANGHTVIPCDLSDPANDHLILPATVGWFSPPCQPFSAAGDQEGEFDDRDGFPWTLRIIDRFRFPVVFIENVKGLTFAKHSDYFGGVLETLRRLGYAVEWKVLNCADYGVPQTRERCIIIARDDGGPITWPMPTHTEQPGMFTEQWVSMARALGWEAVRGERDEGRWVAAKVMGAGMVERGGGRPPRELTEPSFTITGSHPGGFVWTLTRPATTISCDNRVSAPGHKDETFRQQDGAIQVAIAELATLQGFPPGYIFTGTKTAQAKQVGNAVPPKLAQVVTEVNRPIAMECAA
jgi:DNA (cytosine-5)-methyltransferase 1